jgi:hypothetical protein
MSVPANSTMVERTRIARAGEWETRCCRCGDPLEPDIIFGGLRYYVCRPCGQWAVPYPPIRHHPV